jgi:hypothetical protein
MTEATNQGREALTDEQILAIAVETLPISTRYSQDLDANLILTFSRAIERASRPPEARPAERPERREHFHDDASYLAAHKAFFALNHEQADDFAQVIADTLDCFVKSDQARSIYAAALAAEPAAQPMTEPVLAELPELPKPFGYYREHKDVCPIEIGSVIAIDHPLFTVEQLHEYARRALASPIPSAGSQP